MELIGDNLINPGYNKIILKCDLFLLQTRYQGTKLFKLQINIKISHVIIIILEINMFNFNISTLPLFI